MTYFDYIILGFLVVFLVKGVRQGLIKQVTAIIGLVGGLILAWKFYPLLSEWVVKAGIHPTVSAVISFAVIYIAVAVVVKIFGSALDSAAKKLFLGWVNRAAGAVFGLVEGALIVVIILVLVSFTPLEIKVRKMVPTSPVLKQMKRIAEPFSARCKDFQYKIDEELDQKLQEIDRRI